MRADETGVRADDLAAIVMLRAAGEISAAGATGLFESLAAPDAARGVVSVRALAEARGLVIVRDDAAMERWIDEVLAEQAAAVAQIRNGKPQAMGRLIGEVMKRAGGSADAATVRSLIGQRLGVTE